MPMQLSTYKLIRELLEVALNSSTATLKHLEHQRSVPHIHRIIDTSNSELDQNLETLEDYVNKLSRALSDLKENTPPL